jgi:hypothetical protein
MPELKRTDEPIPEWETLINLLVAAVVLARSVLPVEDGQLVAIPRATFNKLKAAVEAAGLGGGSAST